MRVNRNVRGRLPLGQYPFVDSLWAQPLIEVLTALFARKRVEKLSRNPKTGDVLRPISTTWVCDNGDKETNSVRLSLTML